MAKDIASADQQWCPNLDLQQKYKDTDPIFCVLVLLHQT